MLGFPTTATNYGSVIGNWACWAKLISTRAKEKDGKLLHYFSVADIPTSEDECVDAVQSNLTGHSAYLLIAMWEM